MIGECYVGDVRDGLRAFIAAGIKAQTCVTSPPYWGLRDYGMAGQIGLESTPQEYVERMVEVFRLVRDVLADDGTLWLNLGDSYAGSRCGGDTGSSTIGGGTDGQEQSKLARASFRRDREVTPRSDIKVPGIKPKDLVGIPWRVAFALQADGWYLRSDIIWSKPNPMPESVTDRPTKAHEYLFLLTKSERYYYDAEAVMERGADASIARLAQNVEAQAGSVRANGGAKTNGPMRAVAQHKQAAQGRSLDKSSLGSNDEPLLRNRRTVWTVTTQPYTDAHFAVMPTALVEPCVLAGTSARGHCPKCGKGWARVTEAGRVLSTGGSATGARASNMDTVSPLGQDATTSAYNTGAFVQRERITTGWQPSCDCNAGEPVPGIVLDPFLGSGTVAQVAQDLGRRWIGCELNPQYVAMQRKRTAQHGLALSA